jgi:2-oxoisovalerate dehydrogenase E1 component
VPVGEHFVPFGAAAVVRPGEDLTVVSCGTLLHRSLEAAALLAVEGVSCEVIDLRTVVPLDVLAIATSVAKTGRLLVVDEGYAMCGLGAEIAAAMMEHAFDDLDAPVGRLHTDPVAQPFSPAHEGAVVVTVERIAAAARGVLAGRPPLPRRCRAASSARAPTSSRQPQAVPPPQAARRPTPNAVSGLPLIMPNMDLTITEGKVVAWLKKVGEPITRGEGVVEVETDKGVVSVESPADGRLAQIVVEVQGVVRLGQALGTIEPLAGHEA